MDKKTLDSISLVGAQPGTLYGTCKVHKDVYPLRPVISMIKTSEYFLAKYLDTFIQPNIPIAYCVNSTSQFLDFLKGYSFGPTDKMVSFDVVSLFTNIPLKEPIEIIENRVYSVYTKLLHIASEGMFIFNDKLYCQTDGVAMGSPLGPSFANFFLGHIGENVGRSG